MIAAGATVVKEKSGLAAAVPVIAAANLLLHLAFNGRYGFFRDELYLIVCGQRLDFGYVDHPPLTPILASLSRALFGESLWSLRLFPALAGAATVLLAGMIARKLGGGRFAQALAAAAVLVSGVILNFGAMLTNNGFDIFFWALSSYLLILILKEDRPRLWIAFGAVAGLALQNKYSIAFFVAALGIGLLLSPARRCLRSVWPWLGAALAFLIFLPNLIWQVRRGLPFIELNRNAVLEKNATLSPLQFLGGQFFEANPVGMLIILAGLLYLLTGAAMKTYRAFGWAYLGLFAFFAISGGKPYYMAPVYPVMLAAGAVALERAGGKSAGRFIRPAAWVLLLTIGAATAPFAMPILPVDSFIAYSRFLGGKPASSERIELGALPQHFADQFGWPEMARTVARVYRELPESERKDCSIYTVNYGEAAAIDVFGKTLGLPPAISGHNNYWIWGPGERSGAVVICVGGVPGDYDKSFAEVSEAARTSSLYAIPYENDLPIYICRKPKVSLREIWPRLKHYI